MEVDSYVVKLKGIPFSATCETVAVFLAGLDIKGGRKNGVHFTKEESGRSSGECYVELTCQADVRAALKKDRDYMGERWVAVANSSLQEMEEDMNKEGVFKQKLDAKGEFVIKARGVPWSCTADDVEDFFKGCQLKVDKDQSIHILRNAEGRLSGQVFVEFADAYSLQTALSKDREHMGKRYIEVDRSDIQELTKFKEKSKTVSKMREPVVLCRGLPFSATEDDITNFFAGLEIVDLQMVSGDGSRPMGKCFVEFANTQQSEQAMTKSGEKIGARYIEIFQSNRKYWYSVEGGGEPAPRHSPAPPFRSRGARPSPYSKPLGPGAPRGGRVKLMAQSYHGAEGGYDGTDGYPVQDYGPVAGAGSRAGGLAKKQKHIVVVKGVSMDVSMGDVIKFFTDATPPKNVEMKVGEAVVEFNSHEDAMRAMLKDKNNLGGVKVILELQSKPADYVGYDSYESSAPAVAADPYAGSYNDPYQSATGARSNYRW